MTLRTAVAPDANAFVVTGGPGYAVHLESLESSANALARVASTLGRVQQVLYVFRQRVAAAACPRSELAGRIDEECRRLETVVRRCGDEATREASSVRRAAEAYEEEEARRKGAVDGLQNLLVGSDTIAVLLQKLGFGAFVAGSGRSSHALGSWMAAFLRSADRKEFEGAPQDAVVVQRTDVVAGQEDGGTFAYALRSLRQAHGQEPLDDGTSVPPSSILVERFPQEDGSVTVMVTVPGTESWDADQAEGNVFDTESILDGLASRDSHVRTLIRQALAEQNLGGDDRVLFNCYSQGSIHVLGLLEDQEFRDRYRVAAVTSVGGPVSAFTVPDDIPVLSLSNADDIVPAASGRASGPSGSVVDVRTPSRIGVNATLLFPKETVAGAHDLGNYDREAAALDASTAPAVVGFAGTVGAALGSAAAGSQRERFVFTGKDSRTKAGTGG